MDGVMLLIALVGVYIAKRYIVLSICANKEYKYPKTQRWFSSIGNALVFMVWIIIGNMIGDWIDEAVIGFKIIAILMIAIIIYYSIDATAFYCRLKIRNSAEMMLDHKIDYINTLLKYAEQNEMFKTRVENLVNLIGLCTYDDSLKNSMHNIEELIYKNNFEKISAIITSNTIPKNIFQFKEYIKQELKNLTDYKNKKDNLDNYCIKELREICKKG